HLSPALAEEAVDTLGPARSGNGSFLATVLREEVCRTSLPTLLHYEDRSAMAHGIETRVPFLDHRLVEFCLRLPGEVRIRSGVTKAPLRQAMKELLPAEISGRRDKLGYPEPVAHWLRGDAHRKVAEILLSERTRVRGLLDLDAVGRSLAEH